MSFIPNPVRKIVSSFCDFLRFASTAETDIIPVALANAQNTILPLSFLRLPLSVLAILYYGRRWDLGLGSVISFMKILLQTKITP